MHLVSSFVLTLIITVQLCSTALSTVSTKSGTLTSYLAFFHLPRSSFTRCLSKQAHSLISTLQQLFLAVPSDSMCRLHLKTTQQMQHGSAVWTHIPHGNSTTKSQYHEHTHTDAMSQFGNLSCTRGRSHLVCYINNNKRSFHGTSPVLSNHRDLSEAPVNSAVCHLSFLSQISHSSSL